MLIIRDFKITFGNLIFFFRKNVFQPYERARRVGHKNRRNFFKYGYFNLLDFLTDIEIVPAISFSPGW